MAAQMDPLALDSIHWVPPTDAEMKIIEARRERSDKISKLMGDYLLKGYKMLGITCKDCETILLQDRRGVYYCVACKELDSDTDKDNPLTNPTAAISQIREQQQVTSRQHDDYQDPVTSQITELQTTPSDITMETKLTTDTPINQTGSLPPGCFSESVNVLQNKLNWATRELNQTSSVEYSIQLCQLIKSCVEAIQTCH